MKRMELIDKLCKCFETNTFINNDDDAAAEMVRVIKSISEGTKCILLSDGYVGPILQSSFGSESLLWKHVELQML